MVLWCDSASKLTHMYWAEGLMLKLQYFGHWFEEPTHQKRPWCWERLRAGGEGDDRRRDAWMASPTQWTWVWVDSGSWWWTGRPGVLTFMSCIVGHNWATELDWKFEKLRIRLWFIGSLCDWVQVMIPWDAHWLPFQKSSAESYC